MLFFGVKFIHILSLSIAIGGSVAGLVAIASYMRVEEPAIRRASENIAAKLMRAVVNPFLLLALLSGVGMSFINTSYWTTGGFLHAKSLVVVILFGFSHMTSAQFKKLKKLVEVKDEVGINQIKKKINIFFKIQLILYVLIAVLIVFKPF